MRRSNTRRVVGAAGLAVGLGAALTGSAAVYAQSSAQPAQAAPAAGAQAPTPGAPVPAPAAAPGALSPTTMKSPPIPEATARALVRVAMTDLRMSGTPGEAEFSVVADVLSIAHELVPRDEDVLRLLIEATNQLGDHAATARLSRQLLTLAPGDTVAQLNVISARIAELQSADERIAAYEQFLGPKGEGFDPAIRSRLALDCALLHREAGDLKGFTEKLATAAKLDVTNKDAATLVAALVASRGDPADRRLEALALVIMADPLDPASHLELARELASGGASAGSLRFYQLYRSLMEAFGQTVPTPVNAELQVQRWLTEGPAKIVTELTDAILTPRRAAQDARERAKTANKPESEIEQMPNPRAIRLQPELERLWLFAASAAGDESGVQLALAEVVETAALANALTNKDASRPPGLTEERAKQLALEYRASALWCRLVCGRETEAAEKDLAELRTSGDVSAEALSRFEGLLLARKGDVPGARAKLEPLAEQDPMARVAMAITLELGGERAAAGATYLRAAESLRGTMTGAWAWTRAAVVLQRTPEPAPMAATLEAMARGVPGWIDQVIDAAPNRARGEKPAPQPRLLELMGVRLLKASGGPMDNAMIEISLQNMSPIPLALGAEKPLNARFMLAPMIEIGARKVSESLGEVVSLERKLRLMPREEVRARVWADPSFAGWLSELSGGEMTRARWRVLQGFRYNESRQNLVGPYSLSDETPTYVRYAFPHAEDTIAQMAERVRTCPEADLPLILGGVRWRLFRDEAEELRLSPADRELTARALAERYAAGNADVRLLMLAVMPTGKAVRSLALFDEAIMSVAEADARVAAVRVATRVWQKDSKALDAAEQAGEPRLARIAASMRARLTTNPRAYSTFEFRGTPEPPPVPR